MDDNGHVTVQTSESRSIIVKTIATNIGHNNKSYYSFSCTSTVKSWYSGSTSGKNANYGIMIRYNNESINDYNSFYSSDYATESKRPLMTISYTYGSDGQIVWPVPGHYTINSQWGYRNFDGAVHRGIDINCNGANVVAAISGSVRTFYDSSSGNSMVVTKTGSSFQTRYYHLKSYKLTSGTVSAGTAIAVSGSSGNVTGPHLHFQLQWGDANIDIILFLNKIARSFASPADPLATLENILMDDPYYADFGYFDTCVIFSRHYKYMDDIDFNPNLIAHELLHLYGAVDLYYECSENPQYDAMKAEQSIIAGTYLANEIMFNHDSTN